MIIMQVNLNDHVFIFKSWLLETVNDNCLLKILYIYNTTLGNNSFTEEMCYSFRQIFRNTFIPLIFFT